VLENVRAGKLANTAAIPAYVRTVAIRYVYEKFTEYKQDRRNQGMEACERMKSCSDSAEDVMVSAERKDLAVKALRGLPSLQREILYRLYVCQQSKEEIISATGITETQYRLNKSRGKAALMDRVSRSSRAIPAVSKLAGKAAVCLSKLGMPVGAYGSVA
jgi:DNA-directed RNA polymerase specialized sigma24 family protein